MKLSCYIVLVVLLGLLSSCSSERNLDYLKSHNSPKLVVKTPLTKKNINNTYVLGNVGKIAPQSIIPPKG